MNLQPNTGYVDTAFSLLIQNYKELPRVAAIVAALAHEFQQVENAAWDVFVLRAIDNPLTSGVQLDMIGRIVGQQRQGQDDTSYKAFLQARIKTNKSDGRIETLIQILLLLLGQSTPIGFRELYPKSIEIEVDTVPISAFVIWNDFLQHAKDAATSLHFFFSKAPSGFLLKWVSSNSTALARTTTQRFGSSWTFGIGGGVLAGMFG